MQIDYQNLDLLPAWAYGYSPVWPLSTPPIGTTELRALIERKRVAHLWGQRHIIKPRLITEVFGDGRLLVYITPTLTRPNFYVCRTDIRFEADLNGDDFRKCCHLMQYAAEDEFGDASESHQYFPAADFSAGCHWDAFNWPINFASLHRTHHHLLMLHNGGTYAGK